MAKRPARTLEPVPAPATASQPDPNALLRAYRWMLIARQIDDTMWTLRRQGKGHFHVSGMGHEAMATVGLSHKVRSYPRELSGGEQQRVAIARAIVANPSAVLADEPTAALDSANGQTVMTVLARIARNPSRGVLVVAHDPRIIPFANRIIHIEDGRIVGVEPGGAGLKSK